MSAFLLTSIGSMSFFDVVDSLRNNFFFKIIGIDINKKNDIYESSLVDVFYKSPSVTDESYLNFLVNLCEKEKIKYIMPLIDYEVDFFNSNLELFNFLEIKVIIPNESFVFFSRSKYDCFDWFFNKNNLSIDVIDTSFLYSSILNKHGYPIFAKKNNGRSSEGIFIIEDKLDEEYFFQKESKGKYIFQPYIEGEVFVVDVVSDGKKIISLPRREIKRTPNGAGLVVEVQPKNYVLINKSEIIAQSLGLFGCANIEFIFKEGTYYLMDINPRLSAGVGYSKKAGYDFIKNNISCFLNGEIDNCFPNRNSFFYKIFSVVSK